MTLTSPFKSFIEQQSVCILDGGLASELEYAGYDLRHPLWSAKILIENPEEIKKVHLRFLESGADCIISSSYQISYPGCLKLGLSLKDTNQLLEESVAGAIEARDEFLKDGKLPSERIFPLVGASIGPYGAYLVDGSEYRGNYNVSDVQLYDFHIRRWDILTNTKADLFACETIPSIKEARALYKIIQQSENLPVYISFSCKDGVSISDGTPIRECAAIFNESSQIIGIGVNCTSPRYINSLIHQIKIGAPDKEIIVYPNSGENYDGQTRKWTGSKNNCSFKNEAQEWYDSGAQIIGGCCRTRPEHIRQLRHSLVKC